jgi:hypothetical protein
MKRFSTAVLLFGLAASWVRADDAYFPSRVFDRDAEIGRLDADHYGGHLQAMGEPSLWKLAQEGRRPTVYRLLYLPTFYRPISVRVEKAGESGKLRAVQFDGKGGFEPGKVAFEKARNLTRSEWQQLQVGLERAKFWTMPTSVEAGPADGITVDGDHMILEGTDGGRYHVVDRDEPGEEAYEKLCLDLLGLAGWDTEFPYLPEHPLGKSAAERYMRVLKVIKEPSLWKVKEFGEGQGYRFLWLPSSDRSLSIRIMQYGELDGRAGTLHVTDVTGIEPKAVTLSKELRLDEGEWVGLLRGLDKIGFWTLPAKEAEGVPGDRPRLLLEGVNNGRYHVVERSVPLQRDLRELFQQMERLARREAAGEVRSKP